MACGHIPLESWGAGNTEINYELCCRCKGSIGGMERVEGRCFRKGGNMKKQRGNGSQQGQDERLSQAV